MHFHLTSVPLKRIVTCIFIKEYLEKYIKYRNVICMPHFKAIDMINLQYEIGICHTIHNKGTMSQ